MEIRVDVEDITVEIRCGICGNVINILDKYEYHGSLTIDISPCEDCKDE